MDSRQPTPPGVVGPAPHDGGASASAASRPAAENIVLQMPVELWFGEQHIGVKAGTATAETFRRYANSLLSEYRAARAAAK